MMQFIQAPKCLDHNQSFPWAVRRKMTLVRPRRWTWLNSFWRRGRIIILNYRIFLVQVVWFEFNLSSSDVHRRISSDCIEHLALDDVLYPSNCLTCRSTYISHVSRANRELAPTDSVAQCTPSLDPTFLNAFYVCTIEWIAKQSQALYKSTWVPSSRSANRM